MRSHRAYSIQQLRTMLIEEARKQGKPYAFIIGKSSGGYTHTSTYDIQSFKNRPNLVLRIDAKTGEQTLVKGLELLRYPPNGRQQYHRNGRRLWRIRMAFGGAESGYVPVSAIAPSLLLKTVEFQRVKIDQKASDVSKPLCFEVTVGKKTRVRGTSSGAAVGMKNF